ncbi:MAG: aldo/keto reductase [Chloroflexi bacterium]|jgi:aryl-alcohol dehydrogenase-like predicted oxidoreductase|nr:aldo/keto reductase [Chloroflexota bacterium]
MNYRTLGRTGLKVSEIGFGSWAVGGNRHGNSYGTTNDAASLKAIETALELGCNFFDTADVYGHGHSEEIVGEGLRRGGKLNDVVVATKVGGNFTSGETVMDFSSQHVVNAIEASLKRMGRDYIDLYQLHNPSRRIINDGRIFETLDRLKEAGKIRYYGVSVHSVAEGMACLTNGKPDTIQIVYNFFSLLQNDNPAEELFPSALDNNIGIIAREPLANGFLTGQQRLDAKYEPGDIRASWPSNYRSHKISLAESLRFLEQPGRTLSQAALRFVLDEPAVSTTIVGIKTLEQAQENLAAAELPPLSQSDKDRIKRTLFG